VSDALLSFTVPGRPQSWKRLAVVNGRTLTPKGSREAKRKVQLIAQVAARTARLAPPSSETRWAVEVRAYYPDGRQGDVDRAVGIVLDALEGIAYVTDRQVKRLVVEIGTDRDAPRVDVEARRMA
jgi:Holliday junction resolvase RusA-like endonuclease